MKFGGFPYIILDTEVRYRDRCWSANIKTPRSYVATDVTAIIETLRSHVATGVSAIMNTRTFRVATCVTAIIVTLRSDVATGINPMIKKTALTIRNSKHISEYE